MAVARCEQTLPCSFRKLLVRSQGGAVGRHRDRRHLWRTLQLPGCCASTQQQGWHRARSGNRGFDVPDSPMNASLSHGAWEEDTGAEAPS